MPHTRKRTTKDSLPSVIAMINKPILRIFSPPRSASYDIRSDPKISVMKPLWLHQSFVTTRSATTGCQTFRVNSTSREAHKNFHPHFTVNSQPRIRSDVKNKFSSNLIRSQKWHQFYLFKNTKCIKATEQNGSVTSLILEARRIGKRIFYCSRPINFSGIDTRFIVPNLSETCPQNKAILFYIPHYGE